MGLNSEADRENLIVKLYGPGHIEEELQDASFYLWYGELISNNILLISRI